MTDDRDIKACKDTVTGFCTAINEWERIRSILGRMDNGQFVRESQRASVERLTLAGHNEEHAQIFDRFVVPRARKYGSNPGKANSWGGGRFFDVNPETIRSVEFPARNRAE